MDIDSKMKSITLFFYPETNNEKIMKQHWIWIDNEEWESIEKIKQRWIRIDNEKMESIAPFLDPSYKMYRERPPYTPMLEDSIKDFYFLK